MKNWRSFYINSAIITAIILAGVIIGAKMIKTQDAIPPLLPVINPNDIDETMVPDSIQSVGYGHRIQPFKFTDQDNKLVDNSIVKGKIWVAEYFYTTCPSICPIMNKEMEKVQAKYKNDKDFRIVSFTVDPDVDTPKKLKQYAKEHNAVEGQWYFLTGSKKDLYNFARESIFTLRPAEAANKGDVGSDFIHTDNFVLIDWDGRIRGYYEGTKPDEVKQLLADIDNLKGEMAREGGK